MLFWHYTIHKEAITSYNHPIIGCIPDWIPMNYEKAVWFAVRHIHLSMVRWMNGYECCYQLKKQDTTSISDHTHTHTHMHTVSISKQWCTWCNINSFMVTSNVINMLMVYVRIKCYLNQTILIWRANKLVARSLNVKMHSITHTRTHTNNISNEQFQQ